MAEIVRDTARVQGFGTSDPTVEVSVLSQMYSQSQHVVRRYKRNREMCRNHHIEKSSKGAEKGTLRVPQPCVLGGQTLTSGAPGKYLPSTPTLSSVKLHL